MSENTTPQSPSSSPQAVPKKTNIWLIASIILGLFTAGFFLLWRNADNNNDACQKDLRNQTDLTENCENRSDKLADSLKSAQKSNGELGNQVSYLDTELKICKDDRKNDQKKQQTNTYSSQWGYNNTINSLKGSLKACSTENISLTQKLEEKDRESQNLQEALVVCRKQQNTVSTYVPPPPIQTNPVTTTPIKTKATPKKTLVCRNCGEIDEEDGKSSLQNWQNKQKENNVSPTQRAVERAKEGIR